MSFVIDGTSSGSGKLIQFLDLLWIVGFLEDVHVQINIIENITHLMLVSPQSTNQSLESISKTLDEEVQLPNSFRFCQ